MKLYFLRHGIAAEPEDWAGDDFDRPLTDEGIAKMQRAADAMAELRLDLDVIVTSPLVRARQTAGIVARALHLKGQLIEDPRLGGGFGPGPLPDILADHAKADAVLLVGHEPAMCRTVGHLIGDAAIDFKKGTLACVNVPNIANLRGELQWLVTAKILAMKGRPA